MQLDFILLIVFVSNTFVIPCSISLLCRKNVNESYIPYKLFKYFNIELLTSTWDFHKSSINIRILYFQFVYTAIFSYFFGTYASNWSNLCTEPYTYVHTYLRERFSLLLSDYVSRIGLNNISIPCTHPNTFVEL